MPLVFRNWRFHFSGRSRLLSFCKIEHAIGPPRKELETGPRCIPASCMYSKRDANAMEYLRYQCHGKKVPPACRGRCLKGCKQSWYETHAAQNLGIHELNYNTHVVAKGVSNFLCFTVVYSIILYTITQHYIDYYNIM